MGVAMIRKIILLSASLFVSAYALQSNASEPASLGETVQMGCTMPSASGGTVYSIEKLNARGMEISLPSGASIGGSCTQAINSMLQATTSSCSTGVWAIQSGTPVLLSLSSTGYALEYFVFKCAS